MEFTTQNVPDFDSERISYDAICSNQDVDNIGLKLLIDGAQCFSLSAYPEEMELSHYPTTTPSKQELYDAYIAFLAKRESILENIA